MCIVVIKKSINPNYSYFIGLNRDELYGKSWEGIYNHWKDEYSDIFGYKDHSFGGTWFAYNKDLVAILINKESGNFKNLGTRSFIALQALKLADNINKVTQNLLQIDVSKIKPFNLLIISKQEVMLFSNLHENSIKKQILSSILDNDLLMINRSYPNDFNEKRIANNFYKFAMIKEPEPSIDNWKDWESLLTDEGFAEFPSQEENLWLNSNVWGTLISDIVVVPKKDDESIIIHNLKTKSSN